MNKKKDDRRVLKTKRALINGLSELLAKKDIHQITIQELVDKVDIHRSTFYSHYQDIYDLYEQLECSVINDLGAILTSHNAEPSLSFYSFIFQYIIENKQICCMLFGEKRDGRFLSKLNLLIEKKCLEIWLNEWNYEKKTKELEYYVHYHVQGCMAMISMWVQSDFTFSMDELIKNIAELDRHIEKYVMSRMI